MDEVKINNLPKCIATIIHRAICKMLLLGFEHMHKEAMKDVVSFYFLNIYICFHRLTCVSKFINKITISLVPSPLITTLNILFKVLI